MGIIKEGINGPFRGKAGSVVGSSWRKINYIKGLPSFKNKRNVSPEQLLEREKFALLNRFFDPVSSLLEIGFKQFTGRATGRNVAISHNYDHAFLVEGKTVTLNYPVLQFSHGSLFPAGDERAWVDGDRLRVSWDPETYGMGRSIDDTAVLIYYDEIRELFSADSKAMRYEGGAEIKNGRFTLRPLRSHVWLFFVNKATKKVSRTTYIPLIDESTHES